MQSGLNKVIKGFGWRYRRVCDNYNWREKIIANYRGYKRTKVFAPVDEEVSYPSFKSFDEFIDVGRLRSLDGYVTGKVKDILNRGGGIEFHAGYGRKSLFDPLKPGSSVIPLSQSKEEFRYFDLDKPELWEERTKYAVEFAELMDFIGTLPFKKTARMIIMCDGQGRKVTVHRDHCQHEINHEFIWFRTNLEKPFYMQAAKGGKRKYVDSYSAWFDTVNQFHGGDETGKLAISIRIDGVFSDELRKKIPMPKINPASTSALWASSSGS